LLAIQKSPKVLLLAHYPDKPGWAGGAGGIIRAMQNPAHENSPPPAPSFWQAFAYWLRLGFISFGGPAGQIAIMHEDLVVKRRWISEQRFCMP
jgi:hypothetical protein